MAQPIFENESPLDSYLADTEIDLMPGTLAEFSQPNETANDLPVPSWVPSFILTFCQSLESLMYQPANATPSREFAERFKYIIISSPLLSTYLSPAPTEIHTIPEPETPTVSDANVPPSTTISTLLLFLIVPIFFASGNFVTAIIAFAIAKVLVYYSPVEEEARVMQSKLALQSLQGLIEADAAWESAVGEAMELLHRDESSNSSIQWQTPLRIALQSSLQAITIQVDRVRRLFTPLTAPIELAQMTEMYAPPSPINSYQSLSQQQQDSPTSGARQSSSASKLDKRITWNGATSKQLFRRSLIGDGAISPKLEAVPPVPIVPSSDELASFGALALDLQRNKTAPNTPVRRSLMMPRSAGSLRVSPTGASRFTTMQNLRNPLSMSSLDSALQAALGSKRFACAHLLALRFDGEDGESTIETDGEGEDELYWENVRSVIGLLASSLEDETSRLGEALEEWHASRQRDARPSVTSTPSPSSSPAQTSTPIPPTGLLAAETTPRRRRAEVISFAPQTSDMGKMIGHVQSIAGNLDHAFDELENCVATLKKFDSVSDEEENEEGKNTLETSAKSAMDAYEALRRELGMALRECERARGPLLSILRRRSVSTETEGQQSEEVVSPPPPTRKGEDDSFPLDSPTRAGASSPPPAYVSRGPSQIVDDATAHLLAETTTGHLPPPGVDRVYEAETGPASNVGAYRKERSTLSRADRIKLAQAKRRNVKSQGNVFVDEEGNSRPIVLTGEVVEELKEVIKSVNERKQRMAMLPPRRSILESASPRSSVKELESSEEICGTNLTRLPTSRL